MQYMVMVENIGISVRNRLSDVLRDGARIEDAYVSPGTGSVECTQKLLILILATVQAS